MEVDDEGLPRAPDPHGEPARRVSAGGGRLPAARSSRAGMNRCWSSGGVSASLSPPWLMTASALVVNRDLAVPQPCKPRPYGPGWPRAGACFSIPRRTGRKRRRPAGRRSLGVVRRASIVYGLEKQPEKQGNRKGGRSAIWTGRIISRRVQESNNGQPVPAAEWQRLLARNRTPGLSASRRGGLQKEVPWFFEKMRELPLDRWR